MAALPVAILDYGAGNVASVAKAFTHLGAEPHLVAGASALSMARAIVVPGVGHFKKTSSIGPDVRAAIEQAIVRHVPVLGICLGMHWLSEGSSEAPDVPGLGFFRGRCEPMRSTDSIKVPHVGWNSLEGAGRPSRLMGAVDSEPFVYFCHSYALAESSDTTALTRHGLAVSAIAERDLVFGVQFHPEKSGQAGLQLLSNFIRIATREGGRC